MKVFITSFMFGLLSPLVYWVGGNEFVRSGGLAMALIFQIVITLTMLTCPFYPKHWRKEK